MNIDCAIKKSMFLYMRIAYNVLNDDSINLLDRL